MTISTKPGSSYAGFTLQKYKRVDEIDTEVWLFEHAKLGCPLLAIKNSDPNKTFAVAFNTIPTDSTGVAHILEHSVLMGSKKYPIKDVFGEINKGGLTTFLNAMTGADVTYYPFATRNLQEYFNIMDVYCDVVFHPLLAPSTFEQEGWHYHQEADRPLQFQGVVYNEMKGAFSDPIRFLFHDIFKALMPGSTYAHESGGDPRCIPYLTYEDFLAFHEKHYHPTNSTFFLYGDAPLEEELEFLQKRFLEEYQERGEKVEIEEGALINEPAFIDDSYAIESSDTKGKTFLAVGTNVATVLNRVENSAFQVIANILYNSDASPLKNAIIQSGLCKDFGGLYLGSGCFRTLMITYLIGSEPEHRDRFLELYQATLEEMVESGLDKELVLAELNKYEFDFREEASKAQRGLTLIMKAMSGLKYGGDPIERLESEELIKELRHKALNEGYFEQLIKEYLLNNPATVTVVLKPDPEKQKLTRELEQKRLDEYDDNASEEEKNRRRLRTDELLAEQITPNSSETLALLPRLDTGDLTSEIDYHTIVPTQMFTGDLQQEVLVSQLNTNHISYVEAGFCAKSLTKNELELLDLFGAIVSEIGTKRLNYQSFAKELATLTGSFSHSFSCYTKIGESVANPVLKFHFKALPHYLPQALSLIAEVFSEISFADRQHIKEIVAREFAWAEHSTQSEGYPLAATRIFAHLSQAGWYNEVVNGATSYLAIKELVTNYDEREEDFLESLEKIAAHLFNKSNLSLAITAEEQEIAIFAEEGKKLVAALGDKKEPARPLTSLNLPTHEAFITSAEVVFAALGGNLLEKMEEYNGSFEVLKTWLNRDYLWNTVRQMGGAYGCFSQFSVVSGNLAFISYRDPQVQKTYDAYNSIAKAIDELSISEDVLQQLIIGTYGSLNPHRSAAATASAARSEYLVGITPEFKRRQLVEALQTTPEALRGWAPAFAEMNKYAHRVIIGNRVKIEEDGGLFDSFTEL